LPKRFGDGQDFEGTGWAELEHLRGRQSL